MTTKFHTLIRSTVLATAVALAAAPVAAQQKGHGHADHKHTHPVAMHGGVLEDVGEHHVEMLVKDGKLTLYLRDHSAKDAVTEGFKASVLITTGSQRVGPVDVTPAGGNKMEGSVAKIPAGATAILTLTDKSGVSAQGRFKLK